MGTANFIVLERQIDGLDAMMDGKSLARHTDALEAAAQRLGVRPLPEFFSADPAQLAEFMEGEGVETEAADLPPLRQFSAEEGLGTVRALLAESRLWDEGVLRDLQDCERILVAAAKHGVAWHMEVDI